MTIAAMNLEVGYDIPAAIGASLDEIQTPALIIDLDAFERNCDRMRNYALTMNVRLRPHARLTSRRRSVSTRWPMAAPAGFAARRSPRPRRWSVRSSQ